MEKITRRKFVKMAGAAAAGMMLPGLAGLTSGCAQEAATGNAASGHTATETGVKSKVYFTKHIDSEHLIELYRRVNENISGKVAIKLHTGEPHGPNILPRDMVQSFAEQVPNSTIIEANTAYGGARATTERHWETLQTNGWTFSPVDIIDAEGDVNFPVKNGLHLSEVAMGAHLANYDSLVVLTHFKGYVSIHQQ